MKKVLLSAFSAWFALASLAFAQSITPPGGSGGGSGNLTVGTSTITGGTNTKVEFNNSGVLGEYTISGSGNVAMTTSPVLTTPSLGVATATSLASNGCTIGTDNLCVSGTSSLTGGPITTNAKTVNVTATLNAAGTTFDAPLFENVTNTASAAGSLITDFELAGATSFGIYAGSGTSFNAPGNVTLGGPASGAGSAVVISGPNDASGQGQLKLWQNGSTRGVIFSASNNLALSPTNGGALQFQVHNTGVTVVNMPDQATTPQLIYAPSIAVPAGGTADLGLEMSSTAHLGVFFGSGAPTLSAAQGSIYIRTDGSSTSTRLYVNTNGTTGWTNFTSAT